MGAMQATREVIILGKQYKPDYRREIPAEVWDRVPRNNQRALVNLKWVEPVAVPVKTVKRKRRKKKRGKG